MAPGQLDELARHDRFVFLSGLTALHFDFPRYRFFLTHL
jgi:hypothetical protein